MKYLAHLEKDLGSKIVTIQDVKVGLNSTTPQYWEKKEFYSLWRLEPMKAIINTKSKAPHFAYKKGGGNTSDSVGESIEHQFSKKIIHDKKALNLKIGDVQDVLYFSEVFIEKPFKGGVYFVDLYVKIANHNKFDFPIDSYLIIELHKTNKVTNTKKQYFRDMNYAAIEIDIWDKIKYQGNLELLQRQLAGYFSKMKFARFLHNPNYIKHKQERRAKINEIIPSINNKGENSNQNFIIEQTDAMAKPDIQKPLVQISIEDKFRVEKNKSLWQKFLSFFWNVR